MTSVVMTSAVEVCRVLMRFFRVVVVVPAVLVVDGAVVVGEEMGAEDVWELEGAVEVDDTVEVWIVLVFKVEGALEVDDTAEVWTVLEVGALVVDETTEVCAELWIVLETGEVLELAGTLEVDEIAEVWAVLETEDVLRLDDTVLRVDETAEVCVDV